MGTALVGYTGFVGSSLYEKGQIDQVYNSKNITEAYGLKPDLLIYAGLRAEKYLADSDPDRDMQLIRQAEENIQKIAPQKLILVSTVDVFKNPVCVDEASKIDSGALSAYGRNRYRMECWARRHYPDALILRLPALFGKNIKKNFIYDFMNVVPKMLSADKMEELSAKDHSLQNWYELQGNGFYQCKNIDRLTKKMLAEKFRRLGFSALNFTDSRSVYQFYPLERLWDDMQTALENQIRLLHLATEPIAAGELYKYLTGREFCNHLNKQPAAYDFRTVWDETYGGKNGYMMDKEAVLEKIKQFVDENQTM